jgi:hypothetical protein
MSDPIHSSSSIPFEPLLRFRRRERCAVLDLKLPVSICDGGAVTVLVPSESDRPMAFRPSTGKRTLPSMSTL